MAIKTQKNRYNIFILAWWIAFLIIVFLLFNNGEKVLVINDVKSIIQDLGIYGPLFFILIFQLRIVLLLPMSILSILAGVIWGVTGLMYVLAGIAVCATIEFFLARYFFREKVKNILQGKMNIVEGKIGKNAFLFVFFIRLVPNVMFDIQNAFFAVTKVKYKDYIVGTILGMVFGAFVLVYLGDSVTNILLRIK